MFRVKIFVGAKFEHWTYRRSLNRTFLVFRTEKHGVLCMITIVACRLRIEQVIVLLSTRAETIVVIILLVLTREYLLRVRMTRLIATAIKPSIGML